MSDRGNRATRRDFLWLGMSVAALRGLPASRAASPAPAGGWDEAPAILRRIKPPVFAGRQFDITKYGAAGDGKTDCTDAIRRAIAACNQAGGGRVVVPEGVFHTGPIHLQSNVNLRVSTGATLRFNRDPRAYLPLVYTRWEGVECLNYSAFIYADGQQNIAVTGNGTLDGNCDCQHWWPWKGRTDCGWKKGDPWQQEARNALLDKGAKDVPVSERRFGEGSYLRPQFIEPYRCKNVLIEGITITNSPMWQVHPVFCGNVTVRGIKALSHGPNNDGCNPDSCEDVLIENCVFDTGDDCIAIKSGRDRDGRRVGVPSRNIVIRGCQMKDGHGALTVGSEMSGGVRNVFAQNCRLDSPNLNQALRFKTNAMRGGTIEHIFFRDITIGQVSDSVLQIDFNYEEGAKGPERPVVRDIEIRGLSCKKSKYLLNVRGFASAPIRDIRLIHCTLEQIAEKDVIENVEGLRFTDVRVNGRLVPNA